MRKIACGIVLTAGVLLNGCGGGKYLASEIIFDGTYRPNNMENVEFVFSKDSRLLVRQSGIYEFKEAGAGELIVRICLDDIDRELPEDYNFTEYLLDRDGEALTLTYTSEEFDLEGNPMYLYPLKGEDGLLTGMPFDGTYQIGKDGDSYRYVFNKDGSMMMQVRERYYADEAQMTLSDHAGSTEYPYELDGDTLILKDRHEEPVLTLVKKTEQDLEK